MLGITRLFALGLGSASLLLGGCNAVLGIDEAHLTADDSGKKFDAKSHIVPMLTCEAPSDACVKCMATDCTDPKATCLANPACRYALNSYRSCLSNPCSDTDGACLDALAKLESGFGTGLGFSNCVKNTCASECQGSPLVTPCEEYCGCMVQNCTAQLGVLGGDYSACLAACKKEAPADVLCRWTHCEIAKNQPNASHCQHALGVAFCGAKTATEPTCTELSQDDFICERNTDCCSNNCVNSICQASQ